ncbi:MAG: hypothetical protein AAGF11_46470 [Myxococcota bacterium]
MCLFVVDGTWSSEFNSNDNGKDAAGKAVGTSKEDVRTNSRRFFEECLYPSSKKFYFTGPAYGVSGDDSYGIYFDVIRTIEREINRGNCEEIYMVGWSRGATIISEITETLSLLAGTNSRGNPTKIGRTMHIRPIENVLNRPMPPVRFVGLFDSVAMITRRSPVDSHWGEDVTAIVEYCAHVTAGIRWSDSWIYYYKRDPNIQAQRTELKHMTYADHWGVGGEATQWDAREAYQFIRNHAYLAGCP